MPLISTRWSRTGPLSTPLAGHLLPVSDRSPAQIIVIDCPSPITPPLLRSTRFLENTHDATLRLPKIPVAQHADNRTSCSSTPSRLHGRIEYSVRSGSHSGTRADQG